MMPFNKILIFASLSPQPSLLETLRFQTVGFILVMVALGLITLVLKVMGGYFRKSGQQKPATVTGVSHSEKSVDADTEEDSRILLAVIAAAVDSAINNSHRIISIRPVDANKVSGELYLQAWSVEGRRQHFASHKIRS